MTETSSPKTRPELALVLARSARVGNSAFAGLFDEDGAKHFFETVLASIDILNLRIVPAKITKEMADAIFGSSKDDLTLAALLWIMALSAPSFAPGDKNNDAR